MVCIDKSQAGRTVWQMTGDERFSNPAGVVQGGFIAAFCDSAMGASVVTFTAGRPVMVANAEMKISFLGPVRTGSVITCDATVIAGGGRVVFTEASVAVVGGSLVARASSTYLLADR